MTKLSFFSVLLIISAIVFLPANLFSRVTIGSTETPQDFSVLELFSNSTMGLRLPQLTTAERDALTPSLHVNAAAEGLLIFNICTRCVDIWDGVRWVSLCRGETPPAPPVIINCDGRIIRIPQFAHFNLGGKKFETAREQMEYAASLTGTSGTTGHGSLFGGRFQWGRADIRHAISTDGNFTLWAGDGDVDGTQNNAITYDGADAAGFHSVTGQPLGAAAGLFITGRDNWLIDGHSANDNSLWGNGVFIGNETGHLSPPGVPNAAGEFFQSTYWVLPQNDPCRTLGSGWRLPTQEEWELLGNYNCNPAIAPTSFSIDNLSAVPTGGNSPFTWVRVSCIDNECTPITTWGGGMAASETRNGFVIYRTDLLPSGFVDSLTEETNLLADDSPEPFLFLPAAGWRRRDNGGVGGVGINGHYWSSSLYTNVDNSRFLWYSYNGVLTGNAIGRANGQSVRCVRD